MDFTLKKGRSLAELEEAVFRADCSKEDFLELGRLAGDGGPEEEFAFGIACLLGLGCGGVPGRADEALGFSWLERARRLAGPDLLERIAEAFECSYLRKGEAGECRRRAAELRRMGISG